MASIEDIAAQVGPIWHRLHGGLWHTTHPERFLGIIDSGAILPEPPAIPDAERWCTQNGPENYPYVRFIGGVSLFDFADFDPDAYTEKYPMSTWRTFVPFRREWAGGVWIEIDRAMMANEFIAGSEVLRRWKAEPYLGHMIMPIIEAAHLGAVPLAAFKRIAFVGAHSREIVEWPSGEFTRAAYEATLDTWRLHVNAAETGAVS
jgi:hypothetical protein